MIDAVLTVSGQDYVTEIPQMTDDVEAIRGGPLFFPVLKVDPTPNEGSLVIRSAEIPLRTQTVALRWNGSTFKVLPDDFDAASQTGVWYYK